MTSKNKKLLILFLVFGALFLLLFFLFANDENYEQEKDILQTAVDRYVENNSCYPAEREVEFGNPAPLDFQKIYSFLPQDFEFKEDLYYWISFDGRVWISKNKAPEIIMGEDKITYDRKGKNYYYFYYYEDENLKKVETREKEIPDGYAISEVFGNGLASPPINEKYEGYKKQDPLITVKNKEESSDLLSMIEQEETNGIIRSALANIRGKEKWENKYTLDIYGEEITASEYRENDSLGAVKITTADGRESDWVDLNNPTISGTCPLINEENINQDIITVEKQGIFSFLNPNKENEEDDEVENEDEDEVEDDKDGKDEDAEEEKNHNENYSQEKSNYPQKEPSTEQETKQITVIGGPKDNSDTFEEKIPFSKDGFSGLLYKYKDPILKKEEDNIIYDYFLEGEKNFPETISYPESDDKLNLDSVKKVKDGYVGFYKGKINVKRYYQLYRGILRK